MGSYETTTGAGAAGRTAPTLHLKKKLKVVIFPGEVDPPAGDTDGTTAGHLYVVGAEGGDFSCEIAAGPWPGHARAEAGGHTAGETKAGNYTLGPKHHHTTVNWPYSSIAWGATLTERGGIVYASVDGGPEKAVTGKKGVLYLANANYYDKSSKAQQQSFGDREAFASDTTPLYRGSSPNEIKWLQALYDAEGKSWNDGDLKPVWYQGDFGKWAWQLKPTPYYIHTTPIDEWVWMLRKKDTKLQNSHGCIHTHPREREKLEDLLVEGMPVEVRKYGAKGPP